VIADNMVESEVMWYKTPESEIQLENILDAGAVIQSEQVDVGYL